MATTAPTAFCTPDPTYPGADPPRAVRPRPHLTGRAEDPPLAATACEIKYIGAQQTGLKPRSSSWSWASAVLVSGERLGESLGRRGLRGIVQARAAAGAGRYGVMLRQARWMYSSFSPTGAT